MQFAVDEERRSAAQPEGPGAVHIARDTLKEDKTVLNEIKVKGE